MFPGLHDLDEKFLVETGPADKRQGSNYLCDLLQERRLYPRTMERLSNEGLDALQENFCLQERYKHYVLVYNKMLYVHFYYYLLL